MSRLPEGILGAAVTPMRDDGSPDLGALTGILEHQVAARIHGLFVLGTMGEGILLGVDDRKRVLELVRDRVGGRVPIMAHCGAPDTRTAVELTRHAEAVGVDAVAVVAPFYYAHETEALERHFRAVAEEAPGVDLYLYDNPERVGYSLGVDLVVSLVREVPNILGIKDTGDSVGRMATYLARAGEDLDVYAGSNTVILPALAVGARGAVSALANAVPELLVALYHAWASDRLKEARELQLLVVRLQGCVAQMPYVAAVKHLATMRGLEGGELRAPLRRLSANQVAELERRVRSVEALSSWMEPLA